MGEQTLNNDAVTETEINQDTDFSRNSKDKTSKIVALSSKDEDKTQQAVDAKDADTLNFRAISTVNKRLVEEAIRGDNEAVNKVVELYYQDILYFTISQIGNVQDGEDVAQQAITRIITGLNTLKKPEKVKSWMMSIVHNDCMNYMKKKYRIKKMMAFEDEFDDDALLSIEEADREFLPEEALLDEELRKQVLEVIDTLPQNYAETLRLRYLVGLKNSEIVDVLKVNTKKVENDLAHAKSLFKKKLEDKTGIRYHFSAVPLGAAPLLSQVFEAGRADVVTPEMAQRVLAAAHEQAIIQGASFIPTHFGSSGYAAIGTSLVTVVVAGAGIVYALNQNPEVEPEPAPEPAVEVRVQPEDKPEPAKEAPILTIADMIGEEEAATLETFEAGGADADSWQAFIARIGAEAEHKASEPDYVYTMYLLYKQDKQLMLADRTSIDGATVEIISSFGSIEEVPRMASVIFMFP